jgi:hypothetical protein
LWAASGAFRLAGGLFGSRSSSVCSAAVFLQFSRSVLHRPDGGLFRRQALDSHPEVGMASPVAQQGSRAGLISALVIFVILWVVTAVFYFQERGLRERADQALKMEQSKWTDLIDGPVPSDDPKVVSLKAVLEEKRYPNVKSVVGLQEHENRLLIRAVGIDPDGVAGPTTAPAADGSQSTRSSGRPRPAEAVYYHVRNGLDTFYGILSHGSKQAYLAAEGKAAASPAVDAAALGLTVTEGDVVGALERIAEKYVELTRSNAAQVAKLTADVQTESKAHSDLAKTVDDLKRQVADLDATKQSLAAAEQRSKDIQAEIDKLKTDTKAVSQQELDRLNGEISRLTNEKTAVDAMYKKLEDKLGPLEEAVRRYRVGNPDNIVRKADGRIIRVNTDGTCYIDLGVGDQITKGLTFEVYDAKLGIPGLNADVAKFDDQFHQRGMGAAAANAAAPGATPIAIGLASRNKPQVDPEKLDTLPIGGKGSIEVIDVGPGKQSLCRIFRAEPGQTLKEGDQIANLVYDPTIKYRFALYGAFDMDYDGRSKSADTATVRRLVEQWGGSVTMPKGAADLTPSTDMLVVGIAPAIIPLPENASPDEVKTHEDSLNARKAYDEMLEKARALGIPVLNQTRFLYYVGFFEQRLR